MALAAKRGIGGRGIMFFVNGRAGEGGEHNFDKASQVGEGEELHGKQLAEHSR